jgi:hypothetical protein
MSKMSKVERTVMLRRATPGRSTRFNFCHCVESLSRVLEEHSNFQATSAIATAVNGT